MASQVGLSQGIVTINNENIDYIPDSIESTPGLGEGVGTVTTDGSTTSVTYNRNLTEAKGSFKFELMATLNNLALLKVWQNNANQNSIIHTTTEGFTETFNFAFVTTDPPRTFGSDSPFGVEFMSDPAV